jgi:hypothetical protein
MLANMLPVPKAEPDVGANKNRQGAERFTRSGLRLRGAPALAPAGVSGLQHWSW